MIYGIVGLGLMGASYAKRLTDLHETVYGFARREESIQYALEHHMIADGTIHPEELIHRCDIVVLALYPTLLKDWMLENQQHLKSGAIVMDISGVKSNIVEPLQAITREDVELISTHPMWSRISRDRTCRSYHFRRQQLYCRSNRKEYGIWHSCRKRTGTEIRLYPHCEFIH